MDWDDAQGDIANDLLNKATQRRKQSNATNIL
jgi:hypothetical protein